MQQFTEETSQKLKMNNMKEKMISFVKNKNIKNSYFLYIILIIATSLIIKFYFFDIDIPVVYDGISYFQHAIFISEYSKLPLQDSLDNNGWPLFLSFIFRFFNFETAIQFMQIQKITSIILSTITIIPIYYLGKKFVRKEFAIVGAIIFWI